MSWNIKGHELTPEEKTKAENLGLTWESLYMRIERGMTLERALTKPLQEKNIPSQIARRKRKVVDYAIYQGDSFEFLGTLEECAEHLGVKPDTVKFYCKPAYMKRIEKRKTVDNSIVVVKLEGEVD